MRTIMFIDHLASDNTLLFSRFDRRVYHHPTPASLARLRRVLAGHGHVHDYRWHGWMWCSLPPHG